jgi:hypothetical protein
MNSKENWLRLIRNDNPGWIGTPWEPFQGNDPIGMFVADPITQSLFVDGPVYDVPQKDAWGVTWVWFSGSIARNPHITDENKVLSDITRWRETLVFPPLDGHDWSVAKKFVESIDRSRYLTMCFVNGGLFERSHYLMGFEDALCNYLVNPEAMYDLLGAIADWKIGQLNRIMDNMQPDIVHFHDDWGSKTNLFLPPEVWRRIIRPHHQRIVDAVKSRGLIFMHHADCICEPIVEDMAEMGIDIWQGVIPQNDIPAIQKRLDGRMALMGGIDAQLIDRLDYDEVIIRKEVRRCIDAYCPAGHFIPCIPNIKPIYPEVARIYHDELQRYGRGYFRQLQLE